MTKKAFRFNEKKEPNKYFKEKFFLRSGDGHKVKAVTVGQKMRHVKNEATFGRFTLYEFLTPNHVYPSSPSESSETSSDFVH